MALKRAAFARKQQAIRTALQIGDAIRAARQRELAAVVLASWRLRARVGREVQARLARLLRGAVAAAWAAWRRYHDHKVGGGSGLAGLGLRSAELHYGLSRLCL